VHEDRYVPLAKQAGDSNRIRQRQAENLSRKLQVGSKGAGGTRKGADSGRPMQQVQAATAAGEAGGFPGESRFLRGSLRRSTGRGTAQVQGENLVSPSSGTITRFRLSNRLKRFTVSEQGVFDFTAAASNDLARPTNRADTGGRPIIAKESFVRGPQ